MIYCIQNLILPSFLCYSRPSPQASVSTLQLSYMEECAIVLVLRHPQRLLFHSLCIWEKLEMLMNTDTFLSEKQTYFYEMLCIICCSYKNIHYNWGRGVEKKNHSKSWLHIIKRALFQVSGPGFTYVACKKSFQLPTIFLLN